MNVKALSLALALGFALGGTSIASCPKRNVTANSWLAVGQLAETYIDCTQTVTNLRKPHGTENDDLVPPVVVRQLRAGHPGACFLAGAGVVALEYALFRCQSPFYMGIGFIGEAVNIRLNYLVLKGK